MPPPNPAGNSVPDLATLVAALKESAEATKALAALMNRDPKQEFTYQRDTTGMPDARETYPKYAFFPLTVTSTVSEVVGFQFNTRLVEVSVFATIGNASTANYLSNLLRVEFCQTENFSENQTTRFLVPPAFYTRNALFDANTGGHCMVWKKLFPVKGAKFIRCAMTNVSGVVTNITGLISASSPYLVSAYGE